MSVLFADTDVETSLEQLWDDFGAVEATCTIRNEARPEDPACSDPVPCRMWRCEGKWTVAAEIHVLVTRMPYTCAHFDLEDGTPVLHVDLRGWLPQIGLGDTFTFTPIAPPTT